MFGPAQSMGSKKVVRKRGRKGGYMLLNVNHEELKDWQGRMRSSMEETAPPGLIDAPVAVEIVIVVNRPKGDWGTGKNALILKPKAGRIPKTGLDIDKVTRAILDCGTKTWWFDDHRVSLIVVKRRYVPGREFGWEGTYVRARLDIEDGVLPDWVKEIAESDAPIVSKESVEVSQSD